MRRNIKKPYSIDEEQLCMDCFEDYLKHQIGCREIKVKREPNDPPDFWLEVDGKRFAVEVTSLTKSAGYFPRCKRLAKGIEAEAKENGWLCGKYLLYIVGKPEIPKINSTDWRDLIGEGLRYIRQTINLSKADKWILQRDSKGLLSIEKIDQNEPAYIAVSRSDAKFEGPMQNELKEIIQKAISMKQNILKGFRSYCPEIILLLYDAYIYADITDVRQAFKGIEGIDWFHSIFWVQGLKRNARKLSAEDIYSRGYLIFTKNKNWLK